MKKLLTTTAMCLILGTGFNSLGNAHDSKLSITYDTHQFVEMSSQQNILTLAANMYRGDFQKIARSVISSNLYNGEGSALMGSIRMFRY